MQDRPTSTELLGDIADLLRDDVLPALEGPLRHHVRVASNLCSIIERELRLGPDLAAEEEALLRELLPEAPAAETVEALHERLVDAIRTRDRAFVSRAWETLVVITRGKLAVAKPGYDDFDYADEVAT